MSNDNKVWYLFVSKGSEPWTKLAMHKSEEEAILARQHQEQAAKKYQQSLADLGRVGTYLYETIVMDADLEPPTSEEVKTFVDEEMKKRDSITQFMYFHRTK